MPMGLLLFEAIIALADISCPVSSRQYKMGVSETDRWL